MSIKEALDRGLSCSEAVSSVRLVGAINGVLWYRNARSGQLYSIAAQQAKVIDGFRNAKLKLLKTNAAIWSNKICRINQLTHKYVTIKIKGNNQQSKNTKLVAISYRLRLHLFGAVSRVL